MITIQTVRPRNVNSWRAAAILYGDWGTSKAYVLGLAFALAGYSSFWFILGVSVLTLLVGTNYITICKLFPRGGGVYSSVRTRSKALSLLGAFFLISDYFVTASLSALSAFYYLGVPHPQSWAIAAIFIIGMLNFFGPKHTGSLAIALALPTVLLVILLGALSVPSLPEALHRLTPITQDLSADWIIFVSIIIALSGIEAIANITGSMKLDPGSTEDNPKVGKTSTPAIIMVMIEVAIFTALLGLAMNALPDLQISNGNVSAPDYPDARDSMLRYMGDTFATDLFDTAIGDAFSIVVGLIITLLLLSAVNTAMIAQTSLLFILSRDKELPTFFEKLNLLGVPTYSTLLAFLVPMIILLVISDISGLANLYAIGFVGAIAVNLGATATNLTFPMRIWKRAFMLGTCLIMTLIEITLFIEKPHARSFILTIMGLGLLLRTLVQERQEKISPPATERPALPQLPEDTEGGILVAVTGIGKSLDFALSEALKHNAPLFILFLREQKVMTGREQERLWTDDPDACQVFDYVVAHPHKPGLGFLYTTTSHTAHSIAEIAKKQNVKKVIIGRKRGGFALIHALKGTTERELARHMAEDIDLLVIY